MRHCLTVPKTFGFQIEFSERLSMPMWIVLLPRQHRRDRLIDSDTVGPSRGEWERGGAEARRAGAAASHAGSAAGRVPPQRPQRPGRKTSGGERRREPKPASPATPPNPPTSPHATSPKWGGLIKGATTKPLGPKKHTTEYRTVHPDSYYYYNTQQCLYGSLASRYWLQ